MEIREIPLKNLVPSRTLRTEGIHSGDLKELAESIREHGLLQPIRVRPIGHGMFQIIAGHRRFLAHRELAKSSISAVVVDESEQNAAVQSIVENLQREDLTPIELAQSIRELITSYNLGFDEIARLVSKSSAQVRTWVRLANLPDDVLEKLESGQGRTHQVTGLTPRHLQPFVSDLPTKDERAKDPKAEEKYKDRVSDIRQFQEQFESQGAKINAHMADEIARTTRAGEMTVTEAVKKVLSDPDRYRYRPPSYPDSESLESDTYAAHRKMISEMAALAHKLRPEIAVSFSPDKKSALAERLNALFTMIEPYSTALSAGTPENKSQPHTPRLLTGPKASK